MPDGFPAKAKSIHCSRPERLDDYVGAAAKLVRELLISFVAKVERERAFAAVEAEIVGRTLVDKRRTPLASVVAAVGPFDLNYVGAEVGQRLAGEWPR